MKNFILLLVIFFASCKPSSNIINKIISSKVENCPENGTCKIELIPNKSITFKSDAFGLLYPEILDGEKTILKYTYKKNPISNTQDSNYTEIIYAELDKEITELSLTDESLQNVKLFFGRLCYCKGETGYYPIKKGAFKTTQIDKNSINISVDFTIKQVPQIISKINETISLKSN